MFCAPAIDRRALCFVLCFAQAWGGPAAAPGDCAEETPEEDLGKSRWVDCACAKGRKDRRWEGVSAGDGWGPVSWVLFGRCFQAEAAPLHSAHGCALDSGTLSMCAHTGAVKGGRRRGMGEGRRAAVGWNVGGACYIRAPTRGNATGGGVPPKHVWKWPVPCAMACHKTCQTMA